MELIRNAYSSCISVTISALFKYIYIQYSTVQLQANMTDATKQFNIQHLNRKQRIISLFYLLCTCTHFQGSWMAQERHRKSEGEEAVYFHCPCTRQQPAGTSALQVQYSTSRTAVAVQY